MKDQRCERYGLALIYAMTNFLHLKIAKFQSLLQIKFGLRQINAGLQLIKKSI